MMCKTLILLMAASFTSAQAEELAEQALMRHLFRRYDSDARGHDDGKSIVVKSSFTIVGADLVDTDTIRLRYWPAMQWTDNRLQWKPASFAGLSTLSVSADRVWTPDIEPFNALSKPAPQSGRPTRVALMYNSTCIYSPMYELDFKCDGLASGDRMVECSIMFGSWTYKKKSVDLKMVSKDVDISYIQTDLGPFKLVGATGDITDNEYDNDLYPMQTITLRLKQMKRQKSDHLESAEAF